MKITDVKWSFKLPNIKWKITDVSFVSGLGTTPARVNRETGKLWINTDVFPFLLPEHQCFVLCHENAHCELDSTDEKRVDEYAFICYAEAGYSLIKSVEALTKVLDDQIPEHYMRMYLQLERARLWDYLKNNNKNVYSSIINLPDEVMNQINDSFKGIHNHNIHCKCGNHVLRNHSDVAHRLMQTDESFFGKNKKHGEHRHHKFHLKDVAKLSPGYWALKAQYEIGKTVKNRVVKPGLRKINDKIVHPALRRKNELFPTIREENIEDAQVIEEVQENNSPEQIEENTDSLFGAGKGARERQRARLETKRYEFDNKLAIAKAYAEHGLVAPVEESKGSKTMGQIMGGLQAIAPIAGALINPAGAAMGGASGGLGKMFGGGGAGDVANAAQTPNPQAAPNGQNTPPDAEAEKKKKEAEEKDKQTMMIVGGIVVVVIIVLVLVFTLGGEKKEPKTV